MLQTILSKLEVSHNQLNEIKKRMLSSFEKGLEAKESSIKMIPSYVTAFPEKQRSCVRYGIDLGGSNLRVLRIQFENGKMQKHIEYEEIPSDVINGKQEQIFDLIANVIERCAINYDKDSVIDLGTLGFTFSFPLDQTSLNTGLLIKWTKGYNIDGVVGKNVASLLIDAIERNPKLKASGVALLNDTVGTLLCGLNKYEDVKIGFIMGTGSNSCYIEKIDKIKKLNNVTGDMMVINTEYGAFGEFGEIDDIQSEYDKIVDAASLRPGQQKYEKMISGLYLHAIIMEALTNLKSVGLLKELNVSTIDYEAISTLMQKYNEFKYTENKILDHEKMTDEEILTVICEAVYRRAGMIASAGLAALIEQMGEKKLKIAADGSVIQKNAYVQKVIVETLKILCPDVDVGLVLVKDGSGTGAAILASTL